LIAGGELPTTDQALGFELIGRSAQSKLGERLLVAERRN
jgi:hypothetical protein